MTVVKYRIIYADTDQMGVVYHSNYFKFFEMCRGEMMRENNLSYKEVEDKGFMLPIIESHCEYKLPAKSLTLSFKKSGLKWECDTKPEDFEKQLLKIFDAE
jgi:acyl-CoA thioester hydrolase